MRHGKVRHFFAAILLLAVVVALLVGVQALVQRTTGHSLAEIATAPIGAPLGKPMAEAKKSDPTGTSVPVVAMVPMTGGSAKADKSTGDQDVQGAVEPPVAANTGGPPEDPMTVGSVPDKQAPKVAPTPQPQDPNAPAIALEPKLRDTAAPDSAIPASKVDTIKVDAAIAKAPPASADPIGAKIDATFAMQEGSSVVGGGQAPGLRIALDASQITALLKAGKIVIIATDTAGIDAYFLDSPGGGFRPIGNLDSRTISSRYLPINDPGLVAAWSIRLGPLPGHQFNFGLRFTSIFDRAILKQQFASLADQHIDFAKALADKQRVVTDGHVGQDLTFVVDSVKVE